MRNTVCDVISAIVGFVGFVILYLFSLSVQSTKCWETFLPNVGISLLIFAVFAGIVVLLQRMKK
jgi:hypothetical protein